MYPVDTCFYKFVSHHVLLFGNGLLWDVVCKKKRISMWCKYSWLEMANAHDLRCQMHIEMIMTHDIICYAMWCYQCTLVINITCYVIYLFNIILVLVRTSVLYDSTYVMLLCQLIVTLSFYVRIYEQRSYVCN